MESTQDAVLDCLACGACCALSGAVTVGSHEPVPASLTRPARYRAGHVDPGCTRMMAARPDGACAALVGALGVACSCSVYARRPETCRGFEVGSDGCLEARAKLFGGDAPAPADASGEALAREGRPRPRAAAERQAGPVRRAGARPAKPTLTRSATSCTPGRAWP